MQLALRGPMARDLREILAGLRIPADIERIGDYAANVAKRSIALNVSPPVPHTASLRALGKLAARQVERRAAGLQRWRCGPRADGARDAMPNWMRSTPRCSASC